MASDTPLNRVRRLEIKTRHFVQSMFAGTYHSRFKGQGVSFAEVRPYQVGDDVRFIDWRVTARAGEPYVKCFEEERELVVMLMVDVSASMRFGSQTLKTEIAAEIAAILGFSAASNQDKVGLMLFADKVCHVVPPRKGQGHIYRLLRDIYDLEAIDAKTDLALALEWAQKILKKRAIVVTLSDFLDEGWLPQARLIARRHEWIPVVLSDPLESDLPRAGAILVEDCETGELGWIESGSFEFRQKYRHVMRAGRFALHRQFRQLDVRPLVIDEKDQVDRKLLAYFKTQPGTRR